MSTPHIAFRCDASAVIGSGHVMRCLTLAKALVDRGVRCSFLCRDLPGHMMTRIAAEGHGVHALAAPTGQGDAHTADGDYAAWLGVSPAADAIESRAIMDMIRPDRVIVDHYALDADWEQAACPGIPVMAIDDLANRPHSCDILLDQNLGRQASDYDGLVPERALRLIGPSNALLRPEFAAARAEALARRTACSRVKALLITMGGMDRENVTGQILQRLKQISLASDSVIRVVMGGHAPWLNFVEEVAAQMPCSVEVLVDVADMAQLMVDSDLAIGATGSTSWERCCLGLPCISVILADNQRFAAGQLEKLGAVVIYDYKTDLSGGALAALLSQFDSAANYSQMSSLAQTVTAGDAVERIVELLITSGSKES